MKSKIYVALIDEGTTVWRPVSAIQIRDHIYQIDPNAGVPPDENWEFIPGSYVACEEYQFADFTGKVAYAEAQLSPAGRFSYTRPITNHHKYSNAIFRENSVGIYIQFYDTEGRCLRDSLQDSFALAESDFQDVTRNQEVEQGADGKPPEVAQPPHKLNPNTRLP